VVDHASLPKVNKQDWGRFLHFLAEAKEMMVRFVDFCRTILAKSDRRFIECL